MLAGKVDNIAQLFYRYISRKLQKYRFANLLLFVCYCNQYGTEDFWSNASPVDCIIIGIFAESAVQICNFCSSQLFVGRIIGIDIDSQYIFPVLFLPQIL